jgi:hypothetical protein
MRLFLAALSICATPAIADELSVSDLVAREGISAARASLQQTEATPDRQMAIAALGFLQGIEQAYQARWRIGATEPLLPLPILAASLPANPAPAPMRADVVNALARDLDAAMQATRDALPQNDAALVLRPADLWLDVNADGARDADESLLSLIGIPLPEGAGEEIRFDAADLDWLRAYTHLISAISQLILAFDPEPALAQRLALAEELERQFADPPGQLAREPYFANEALVFGPLVDRAAVTLQTLRHQPDRDGIARAADHLRAMIAANHDFWTAVRAESDNDREWIPNDDQQAALGFDLPPDAGTAWLAVLDDARQVLDGRMLIPFWRFAPTYGIDLGKWLEEPRPVDPVDWLQGTAALPYRGQGITVSRDNWSRFLTLFQGRAGLYMVLFN